MNRLIIIGNGFDLAHGIKTSYHDFLLDYLKKGCLEAIDNDIKQYKPIARIYFVCSAKAPGATRAHKANLHEKK
jgi:hypothetical protein